MARDFRNDFIQEVQLGLYDLEERIRDKVMAIVINSLDRYEITERSTEIVPYDTGNLALLKMYAGCMVVDGLSQKTVKHYINQLKRFARFLNNKDFKTITTFDIRNYLAKKKVDGVVNSTLESIRACISAFCTWMTEEDYIDKNPCATVKKIKVKDEIRLPFSSVDIDKIRSSCKNEKERAIIEVLLSSGVRVEELTNLQVGDIDFVNKSVHVRHGKGDKERYTYIDDVACEHLIKYLQKAKKESGFLFSSQRSGQYSTNGIREMLLPIAKRAGVEDVHPHRFRRTFATRLAARGMDLQEIQKLMGHANINTTMTYIHLDDTQIRNSFRKHIA